MFFHRLAATLTGAKPPKPPKDALDDGFRISELWHLLSIAVAVVALAGGAIVWVQHADGEQKSVLTDKAHPGYQELRWEQLVPKGWDPTKRFRAKGLGELDDSDPKAVSLARQMRETWDNAPIDSALDGSKIVMLGYVVPLQANKGDIKEFLLVPYFGACIHVPPPPANQIVHVTLDTPATDIKTMSSVRVMGTMRARRQNSAMGVSGYSMEAVSVERYSSKIW